MPTVKEADPRTMPGAVVKLPSGSLASEKSEDRNPYKPSPDEVLGEKTDDLATCFKVGDLLETSDGMLALIESRSREGLTIAIANGNTLTGRATDLERWGYKKLWSEGDLVTPKHNPGSRYGTITGFNIKNKKTPLLIRFDGSSTEGKWGRDAVILAEECNPYKPSSDEVLDEEADDSVTCFAVLAPHTPNLDVLAESIRQLHIDVEQALKVSDEARRSALQHAKEAGDLLLQAKAQVKHGTWENWREDNLQIPSSTASLYQRVAQNWQYLQATADSEALTLRAADSIIRGIKKSKTTTVGDLNNESNHSQSTASNAGASDFETASTGLNPEGGSQGVAAGQNENSQSPQLADVAGVGDEPNNAARQSTKVENPKLELGDRVAYGVNIGVVSSIQGDRVKIEWNNDPAVYNWYTPQEIQSYGIAQAKPPVECKPSISPETFDCEIQKQKLKFTGCHACRQRVLVGAGDRYYCDLVVFEGTLPLHQNWMEQNGGCKKFSGNQPRELPPSPTVRLKTTQKGAAIITQHLTAAIVQIDGQTYYLQPENIVVEGY